jgi:hypothetical protein
MKKVEIKQFDFAEVESPKEQFGFLKIPTEHKRIRAEGENLTVSDGYHTFDELYDHRITLFISLCRICQDWIDTEGDFGLKGRKPWRSLLHSDGSKFDGWFILGIGKAEGFQMTYHLPIERWGETDFAETLEKAPEWDGHTPADVLERLKTL